MTESSGTQLLITEIKNNIKKKTNERNIALCRLYLQNFEWYILEFDPTTGDAFGFVNLDDPKNSELGYFNINEILDLEIKQEIKDLHMNSIRIIKHRAQIDKSFHPSNIHDLISLVKSSVL